MPKMNNYPKATKVASFIVARVIMWQEENNCVVSFGQVEGFFPALMGTKWRSDEPYLEEIKAELAEYPQFKDNGDAVFVDDEGFDCVAWTNYIASDYDAEQE